MKNSYSHALESEAIEIITGDGRLGYEKYAPYDIIHVGAGKYCFVNNIASEKIP